MECQTCDEIESIARAVDLVSPSRGGFLRTFLEYLFEVPDSASLCIDQGILKQTEAKPYRTGEPDGPYGQLSRETIPPAEEGS